MRIGSRYETVIWDFDGTIMDTYPAIVRAYSETATEDFGLDVTYDEVWDWAKIRLRVCRRNIALRAGVDDDAVEARYRARYVRRDIHQEEVFPGAREALRGVVLSGGHNFLVTHRSSDSLREYLTGHDLGRYFVESVAMLEGFPPKPAPHAFNYLIDRYRISRARTLSVGDRHLDVEAALNARVDACFFHPGGHTDPRATFNIAELTQLMWLL